MINSAHEILTEEICEYYERPQKKVVIAAYHRILTKAAVVYAFE
jgi:hypothetical protein